MGMIASIRRLWYGPDTSQNIDLMMGSARQDWIHSGVVSVTDVQESLTLASSAFKGGLHHAPPGSVVVVRSYSGTGTIRHDPVAADISAAEWESVGFTVGFATEAELARDEWNRYQFSHSVTLSISPTDVNVNSHVTHDASASVPPADQVVREAHDAAVKGLSAGLKRRTPPVRWAQLRSIVMPLVILALWLWAMLTSVPVLPVWLFSGAITVYVAYATLRSVSVPKAMAGGSTSWVYGAPLVDLTPRSEMLARRASGHRDAKVVAVSVAATLVAAVLTAYFTGLWTPGAAD
ncbi:hypothetical protein [Cellulosimicrobium sp. SH8]|uniref:hypothetical protein n=1 Tax=Cellulosimicrobium sp. SH8 TaxID=2952936 RepID=UPI0021F2E553|nr:hypothetical protein [Cellulosimicrobium sp. SH8]